MKKRFLPFSLLLVIMILGQSVIADQGGHYVPRTQPTMNAESYMGSLRANQNTGLIDPADMFKAMQAPATKDAANDPLYWISMGPDNMGGQTTAIVYDNQSNVVYIGSKGGGVYKTYNFGVTWHQVGNLDLMVSTMVQDENGIIYVGTGDGGVNIDHNGLTDLNYSNSFIGTGIYTIDVRNNDLMKQVVAPTADEWLYVNELAVAGNKLLAATPEGLKYSTDKGQTWQVALEGNAEEVKVGSGNVIVASVDGMVYIGTDVNNLECHSHSGTNEMQGDTLLAWLISLLPLRTITSSMLRASMLTVTILVCLSPETKALLGLRLCPKSLVIWVIPSMTAKAVTTTASLSIRPTTASFMSRVTNCGA